MLRPPLNQPPRHGWRGLSALVAKQPLRSRAAGSPPTLSPPRTCRSARHAARQAPGIARAQARRWRGTGAQPTPPFPAVPCRTWTSVNLHVAEAQPRGARVSGPLAAQKRCRGAGAQQGRCASCARLGNRPRRGLEAGSRAARWARCSALVGWLAEEEVVAQGRGALGAALEADMRSGGAGAAQAGRGWVRTLLGARWGQEGGE